MTRISSAVDELRRTGYPVGSGKVVVAEHAAKGYLASFGASVPRGLTVLAPHHDAWPRLDLGPRVVLKAWGPNLVHKSDVGAVALGLSPTSVPQEAADMAARLRERGIEPTGFLIEEQAEPGVEVILGVVNRSDFGPVVMLGLGGIHAETLGQSLACLAPLDERSAADLVDQFPGAALMDGLRGQDQVDKTALTELLLAVAGPSGLVTALGDELVEFECNPVIVSRRGAIAVDARLILRDRPADPHGPGRVPPPPDIDFAHLFEPKNIAVVGASTTKVTFGNRYLRAYRNLGWMDGLYAVHPHAAEIDGVPAYPSVKAIGDHIDYLLVAVPASSCASVIRSAAGSTSFAQVISGGFREAGPDGRLREAELLRAAREGGMRLIGPNCLGVYSPLGRQTWQLRVEPVAAGSVSIVSQSGGLAGDIIRAGEARGLRFANVVTVGNAADVGQGEMTEYFLSDPQTSVIGLYVEGPTDADRLLRALRQASGCKPVVVLVGALSSQGADAAISHTASMTGDREVWAAVAHATGVVLVDTLEALLSVLLYLQRYAKTVGQPRDPTVQIVGPGGGAAVLAADACDRRGLTQAKREDGRRTPLELGIGPGVRQDALDGLISSTTASDVLVHINLQPLFSMADTGIAPVVPLLTRIASVAADGPRIGVILRNLETAGRDGFDLGKICVDLGLPAFQTFDEACLAIKAMQRFAVSVASVNT